MGGGAAIRAAAKVAGISAFAGGFRASTAAAESSVTVAARNLARPLYTDQNGLKIEQAAQRPACELSDWELAGSLDDERDVFVVDKNDSVEHSPRFVFGPVPSFEESQQATFELKDALDRVYLSSPKSAGSVESLSSLHETKACISNKSSVPESAMQAFKLLKESPVAQTVVASIASDPNVWNAVMQNPTLVEFLEADRKNAVSQTEEPLKSSKEAEVEAHDSPKSFINNDDAHDSPSSYINNDDAEESGNPDGLIRFIEDVKVTVADLVGRFSSFIGSLFHVSEEEEKGETSYDTPRTFVAGGSFMALAMMVIMVVLMKRN